ncbi:heme-binding protein [Thioclava sp. GXIMD2076]|uniref:heme-degrading domain-containing protein n=1 Tax=Thioclava sp. GXIMD2076 TaxID=3131931 RepID=UPI0030D2C84F
MEYTLASLAQEQSELGLSVFNYDFIWDLGQRLQARAKAEKAPVAITISHGTDLVFCTVLEGATVLNLDWAARKRAVAHQFHRSSLSLRIEAEEEGHDFNKRYLLPDSHYFATGGGVPLMGKNGTYLGAVAVSGLPDVEDHRMIVETLRDML